jgi:RNA polymerase sigma-70 factor, ECF subfamily
MNLREELELVARAQGGDREALGALWDELTPKLFGYLVNVTGDRPLAEDLLQTTWLNAMNALPRFEARFHSRDNSGIGAWLFAIARNECRQHWRKAKHEPELLASDYDAASAGVPSPDNKLMVEQALNLLSEGDCELLRLRYIADLPVKEVARVLNVNSVAVRVRLHRAIARARAILTETNF